MNAPVLALIGQIPQDAIGRGSAICTRSAIRPASWRGSSICSARITAPAEAPRLVAEAMRSMFVGRPGPAALECAIDVWGSAAPVAPIAAACRRPATTIDDDAVGAAAKRLGAAKRPLIVAGGGAQDASAEVTALSAHAAGAGPVLSARPRRAVGRDPLHVNLPLGRELWGEADVVLAIGTQLFYAVQHWGIDNDLAIVRVDADPEEPARLPSPPSR